MSIQAALNTGVTGLTAFGNAIAAISTNVANVNTVGYKTYSSQFQTLIAGSSRAASGGGVLDSERAFVSQQGVLQATTTNTDLAISGQGFFVTGVVGDSGDITNIQYQRAGNFEVDSEGNFITSFSDQQRLLAWRLDSNGNKPGEGTNPDTTPSQLISSLEAVNIQAITGEANPTTTVNTSYNLDATETQFLGSFDTTDLASSTNTNNDLDDLIVPQSFANGEDLSIIYTTNGTTSTAAFTYQVSTSIDFDTASALSAASTAATFAGANDDDTFTITVDSVDYEFTFQSSNPSDSSYQFNSLSTLAEAINETDKLVARIDSGILYIGDLNGEAVTFTEGTGATFVNALDLDNLDSGWSTFNSLAEIINDDASDAVYATTASGSNNLNIGINDSTGTFVLADGSTDDILTELGLDTASTTFGPRYSASDITKNMSSGNIAPDFSSAIQIFDGFGAANDFQISFLKTANNEWAYEIYSVDADAVTSTDGQVTSGVLTFNGDGTLDDVTGLSDVNISWENGSADNTVDFTFAGTTQFAGSYKTVTNEQDGLPVGDLAGISTDEEGIITAFFSNGTDRALYKIPLALFPNPDGLTPRTGGAYLSSDDSGEVVLEDATENGAGTIFESTLEGSTADTATEFTGLIAIQSAYTANARTITVAQELLEEITNIIR